MSDEEAYFVCVYYDDGEPIGHRAAFVSEFPTTMERTEREKELSTEVPGPTFPRVVREFLAAMMGYLEYVPVILELTPIVSHRMVTGALHEFLKSKSTEAMELEGRTVFKFDMRQYEAMRRFQENLEAAAATSRSFPRLLTVGLVTTLEGHLTDLMKLIATRFPEPILAQKTLALKDVFKYGSIEELRDGVISEEIGKVQRDNINDQVGWIIDKLNLNDFRKTWSEWPLIVELHERRNVFVHAKGVVGHQYIRAQEQFAFNADKKAALGDELHANPAYFTASVNHVLRFGSMLQQIVWRKVDPASRDHADKAICDLGYELIGRGEYKLACRILEFARDIRGISDLRKKMSTVNLANAHKLAGDATKAKKILDGTDWGAVGLDFKVCIAAIRDNVDEVVTIMHRIGSNNEDMPAWHYEGWPAFYSVREDARFIQAFREIFGVDFVPSAMKQAGIAQVYAFVKGKTDAKPRTQVLPSPDTRH